MNEQYLEFAKTVALEAGETMRKYFLHAEREWKEDQTPLTIADTTINRMVIERVAEKFPDHSVLGEEESAMQGSRYTWVCDPVDGTMPYSHGLAISTFSLALCEDGVPIVGVVYDPFMNRLFWASEGNGAFCNDKKLQVSNNGLKNALIDLEAIENGSIIDFKKHPWTELHSRGAKTTHLWSAILPSSLVAAGEYTAVIFGIDSPHDPAAIKIIIEEAGGRVTDLFGNDQRYDRPTKGFIASNGIVHDELVEMVKEASG